MDKDSQRLLAALCYILWPVALVLLLAEPKKKELRYDAINGLGFAVALFVLGLLFSIVTFVPFLGWALLSVYWIFVIVMAIMYAIQAYEGKKVVIPVVTDVLRSNVKDFR